MRCRDVWDIGESKHTDFRWPLSPCGYAITHTQTPEVFDRDFHVQRLRQGLEAARLVAERFAHAFPYSQERHGLTQIHFAELGVTQTFDVLDECNRRRFDELTGVFLQETRVHILQE